MSKFKMSVTSVTNRLRNFYEVAESTIQVASVDPSAKKSLGHHIILVDRSGSMYYEMASVALMLEKVLTLQEFADSSLKVSLISYSSKGDTRTHFERVPISEIMQADSQYLKEIRNLRAGGLTCMSQSLKVALPLIREEEVTGVTLHSDGYANDPSAFLEKANMESFLGEIKSKNVFLNTIAYQSYADHALLSRLASLASGCCVQARSSKEVFQSIQDTTTLLGASVTHSESISCEGFDRVIVTRDDPAKKQLNTFKEDGELRGLEAGDLLRFYKYRAISSKQYYESNLPDITQATNRSAYFALAISLLNDGELNAAKEAAYSSADYTGFFPHMTALSPAAVKSFMDYLQEALFDQRGLFVKSQPPVFPKQTLLDFIQTWDQYRRGVTLDMAAFLSGYKRKGLKRIAGTRNAEGEVVKLPYSVKVEEEDFVTVNSFVLSKDSPNINMNVQYQAAIYDADDLHVTNVAGVDIRSLATYRNYTLVNNGELYTKNVRLKFNRKSAFLGFQQAGFIPLEDSFDPQHIYDVDLTKYMLCAFDFDADVSPVNDLKKVFMCATIESLAKSMLKESSVDFSTEQIQALKAYGLTPALNISTPTIYEFSDLKKEVQEGRIDTRNFFRVKFGTKDIPSTGALMSANKFLDRMYVVKDAGTPADKPTGLDLLADHVSVEHKQLSAKLKVTPVDLFQKQVFDHLFSLGDDTEVANILAAADVTREELFSNQYTKDQKIASIAKLRSYAGSYQDAVCNNVLVPLAYYISVTGLLPEHLDSPMMTGEQIVEKYPSVKLSKAEKEGLFFVAGELLISVSEDTEYYYTKN